MIAFLKLLWKLIRQAKVVYLLAAIAAFLFGNWKQFGWKEALFFGAVVAIAVFAAWHGYLGYLVCLLLGGWLWSVAISKR